MEETLALRILQAMIGIIGILGNGLVCVVILKVPSMQTRTNAFIFHQAVVDLLGSTMTLLQSEAPLPDPVPDNALGWIVCHVWFSNFVLFLLFIISTFNLLSLTMERYFAIVHPFRYQAAFYKYPKLKVGLIIATCWICAGILKSYSLTVFKLEDGQCVSAARSRAVGILTAILQYVVPVAVMLFAYIRIGVELKRGAARVGPAPSAAAPQQSAGDSVQATGMMESLLRARRNTFKMLWIVFVTFFICWTPSQVFFLLFNLGLIKITFREWYTLLALAMVSANCCVNPIIYAFKYQAFRRGMKETFGCRQNRNDASFGTQPTG